MLPGNIPEFHREVGGAGSLSGIGQEERRPTILTGYLHRCIRGDCLHERRHFISKCSAKPIEEKILVIFVDTIAEFANGCRPGFTNEYCAVGSEYLGTNIVPKSGPPAVFDGGEGTAGELHGDDTGVDIAKFRNVITDNRRSGGVNLLRVMSHQPADAIEIVDGHVPVEAARAFRVGKGWWFGIPHGIANELDFAQLSRDKFVVRGPIPGIETTLEADLKARTGTGNSRQCIVGSGKIQGDRLFRKGGLARLRRSDDEGRMSFSG